MKYKQRIERQAKVLYTNIFWKYRLGKIGKRSIIEKPQKINNPDSIAIGNYSTICAGSIFADLDPGGGDYPKIIIGDYSVINYRFQCNSAVSIKIGDYCSFASNVFITDSDHIVERGGVLTKNKKYNSKPVVIGRNCWLAQNVVILKGVTIGDNCTIGANSVVTKDIPANSIAVGIPAKVIKEI